MQDAFYEWKCSPRADLGLPFLLDNNNVERYYTDLLVLNITLN